MDKYESEHNKTIERYAMLIKQLFGIALNEFAQVASIVEGDYSGNEMFNFDDYQQAKATVAKIVNTLANNMNVSVVNGCKAVWDISNKKNNALVESLFKGKDLTDEQKIRYFQNNEPALKAFTERKHNGLRLSDRVWNIVGGYKNDIETALSVSIEQGKSAHDLAKEVQQYLNEPDKLFRRVRDEFGELQLSKNAKSYHPGAGVYRSSYKNALRLARTEINMAYRTADFTRYQQLDFIVGIEIKTSGNHPEHDICDQLQGRYPKDFKFVGWHPNCRCYQKTILKTEEEMERDEERMRKGQEPTANSKNSVDDVPDEFKEWVEDNEDKIKRAKSKPYFVTDNPKYISGKTIELTPEQRKEVTLKMAKERHAARTQEQVDDIKGRWSERQTSRKYAELIHNSFIMTNESNNLVTIDDLKKVFGDNLPKTLPNINSVISKYQRRKDYGKIAKEYKNEIEITMRELFQKHDLGMNIKDSLLEKILNSHFKNQFETGTSGGALYSNETSGLIESYNGRLKAAHKLFVGDSDLTKQFERKEYEKYGNLLDHNILRSITNNTATTYGNVEVRFKKDKVIATWTAGDSLGCKYQPSLVTNPQSCSFDNLPITPKSIVNTDNLIEFKNNYIDRYVELQFHGNLTVDCVESLAFPYDIRTSQYIDIATKWKQKGVKIYYVYKSELMQL